MRTLLIVAAVLLANIVGLIAFLAAGKLAVHLNPAANESHITSFIVAIIGVIAGVAAAFPIFARGVPWTLARLELSRPGEDPVFHAAQQPYERP